MQLTIKENILFNTELALSGQSEVTQEHVSNVAFDYGGANPGLSVWQGDGSPGQPMRYESLVHDIPTLEGAVIRTTVTWKYSNPYGSPASFAGTSALRLEVLNG